MNMPTHLSQPLLHLKAGFFDTGIEIAETEELERNQCKDQQCQLPVLVKHDSADQDSSHGIHPDIGAGRPDEVSGQLDITEQPREQRACPFAGIEAERKALHVLKERHTQAKNAEILRFRGQVMAEKNTDPTKHESRSQSAADPVDRVLFIFQCHAAGLQDTIHNHPRSDRPDHRHTEFDDTEQGRTGQQQEVRSDIPEETAKRTGCDEERCKNSWMNQPGTMNSRS